MGCLVPPPPKAMLFPCAYCGGRQHTHGRCDGCGAPTRDLDYTEYNRQMARMLGAARANWRNVNARYGFRLLKAREAKTVYS